MIRLTYVLSLCFVSFCTYAVSLSTLNEIIKFLNYRRPFSNLHACLTNHFSNLIKREMKETFMNFRNLNEIFTLHTKQCTVSTQYLNMLKVFQELSVKSFFNIFKIRFIRISVFYTCYVLFSSVCQLAVLTLIFSMYSRKH